VTMTVLKPTTTLHADDTDWDVPKLRHCLWCKTEFLSDWSGEWVCRHCKSKSAWRNG